MFYVYTSPRRSSWCLSIPTHPILLPINCNTRCLDSEPTEVERLLKHDVPKFSNSRYTNISHSRGMITLLGILHCLRKCQSLWLVNTNSPGQVERELYSRTLFVFSFEVALELKDGYNWDSINLSQCRAFIVVKVNEYSQGRSAQHPPAKQSLW